MNLVFFSPRLFCTHAQVTQGMASYYAKKSTGSTTANGERLHHDSMTCAHRSLPFGTLLRVTNLENDKSVIVRVNDRGPYIKGRIIDLSWGAAKAIGMLQQGISKVQVEPAYAITIPLAAEPMIIQLPKLSADHLELPDTLRAIWQEDELIEHPKIIKRKKVQPKKNQVVPKSKK